MVNNKNLINRLERKFGKYAIKNLIIYILLAYVVGYVFVITDSRLHIYDYITMNPELVMQGQVWRLFTWICTVPQTLGFLVIFMFIFYYFIGRSLEATLGAFKYNLYMISGWFFMTLGAMVVYWVTTAIYGPGGGVNLEISTYYLNLASFLAFALLYPNQQVYFFFLIPIKMKWLAIVDVAYLIFRVITYVVAIVNIDIVDFSQYGIAKSYYAAVLYAQIFSIIISLLNFVIFYFMIRRVTPKNIRNKVRDAHAQRQRQQEWNRNWEQAKKSWNEKGYQSGETKWGEKSQNNTDRVSGNDKGTENGSNDPWAAWDAWLNVGREDEGEQKKTETNIYEKPETKAERKRREKTEKYKVQEYEHRCEVCGRTNISHPDLTFRFCSKCEGNHEYCEDHIFEHEHLNS